MNTPASPTEGYAASPDDNPALTASAQSTSAKSAPQQSREPSKEPSREPSCGPFDDAIDEPPAKASTLQTTTSPNGTSTGRHETSPGGTPAQVESAPPTSASIAEQQSCGTSSERSVTVLTPPSTTSPADTVLSVLDTVSPNITSVLVTETRYLLPKIPATEIVVEDPIPRAAIDAFIRGPQSQNDPMLRSYPKPKNEVNVAEALEREPMPWSIGYWKKNAKVIVPKAKTAEVKKRECEEAKALLRAMSEKK